MQLAYRPSPAELQAAAAHSHASTTAPAAPADSNTVAELYAHVAARINAVRNGFNDMNEYPIVKHAGPMFIHQEQNTFCGICGMCITLEDEQAVSRQVNPYTVTGPGSVQHADAGNEEFEELQQGLHAYEADCYHANERKFGVMPKPGWTGLYRVVIRQRKKEHGQDKPSYYISGVGRYHLWDSDPKARKMYNKCTYNAGEPVFTVPKNKDDELVDRQHFYNKHFTKVQEGNTTQKQLVKRVSVYPCHFHDEDNQDFFPHGFPIHANCWKIAVSVIGADRLEKELGSFLAALRTRWTDEVTIVESREIADWIVNERWHVYNTNRVLTTQYDQYDVDRILVAMNDPIHIDEVEEMIAESARRYRVKKGEEEEEEDKGMDSGDNDTWSTDSVVTITQESRQSLYDVPQECMRNILDELHHSEVEAFLNATKIGVPQWYWRRRAPRDVIWELDCINEKTTPLDWQYLCLRAERMCEESLGLINRQRICSVLRKVGAYMA